MLNTPALAAALSGLVGYRPLSGVTLPAPLPLSTSGLYVQDYSELLSTEVLQAICPRGETVGAWLTRLQGDALLRLATSLVSAQQLDGKVLLPTTRLIKRPGNRANTINKLGRFVGLRLTLPHRGGVSYQLPAVSLQLDGMLTEPLPLYLYSDTEPEPVQVLSIEPGNVAYFPYVVDLDGLDLGFAAGGAAYLGYYEDDLPLGVHAIQADLACGCSDDTYPLVTKWLGVTPFTVGATYLEDDKTLFDTAQVSLDSQSFGLNPHFLAYCDVVGLFAVDPKKPDVVPDNATRLAPAVQMALAVRLFEALVSSPNVTRVTGAQEIQADAQYALYSTQAKLYGGKVAGTDVVYPSLLKSLTLDLSGLASECGPPKFSPLSMGRLVR